MKKIIIKSLIVLTAFFAYSLYAQTSKNIKIEKKTIEKKIFDSISPKKSSDKVLNMIKTSDTIMLVSGNLLPFKKECHASYYADKFHGKRTASGAKFNMNGLTAAHKKFAFGTKLKITNEANGKSVLVTVNDRGPYVKGREIDLSKRAFMQIASSKGSGSVIVTIEELK
jgi:rare lipoprotein A